MSTAPVAAARLRNNDVVGAHDAFAALVAGGDRRPNVRTGYAWSCERLARFDLATPLWNELAATTDDPLPRWRALIGRVELGDTDAEDALVTWAVDGEPHRGVLMSASTIEHVGRHPRVGELVDRYAAFPDRSTQSVLPQLLDRMDRVAAADELARSLLRRSPPGDPADPITPVRAALLQLRVGDHVGFEASCAAVVCAELERPTLGGMRSLRRWLLRPDSVDRFVEIVAAAHWQANDPLGAVAVAEAAIAVGVTETARRIAESLASSPAAVSVDGARLLAWADVGARQVDRARRRIAATEWPATRHQRLRHLAAEPRPVREDPAMAPIMALGAMHDEMGDVEEYLQHHRALGIRCFWIVDDRSTDGTREHLLAQPDVEVFDADDQFTASSNGSAWFAAMARRLPPETRVVVLDADERLVLPPPFDHIDPFVASIDNADAVHANVVDLFVGAAGDRCFDRDLIPVGRIGAPYRGLVGGVRYRILDRDTAPELVKTVLIRADRFVPLWSTHEVAPVRMAGVSVALLHTKLLGAISAGGDGQHLDRRQAVRLAAVTALEPGPHSVAYDGPHQLAALGLVGRQLPVGRD